MEDALNVRGRNLEC